MARHYLDHASTSPARPEAVDAVVRWLRPPAAAGVGAGDPGRIHAEGLQARVALEEAREQVATLFGARAREVVFTSGATESIATAVHGTAARGTRVLVPAVEHSAVRATAAAVAAAGGPAVVPVGVDRFGRIDTDAVRAALTDDVALAHVQWANHEVGTRQPVAEIVAACRAAGVLVHVDAACAAGHDRLSFRDLDADLVSISAHKLGGPPGVGALLVRRGLRITPLLVGGDQERARRAGLENLPAVAGFGAACAALATDGCLEREAATARRLTDRILAAVPVIGGLQVHGDPVDRVPHIVCLGVDGIEPQAVLLGLDQAGIAAHSGSACSSESLEPSPVLEAMGVDAHHSLRLSVGWTTTDDDIDALLDALPTVLARLRALRGG